jgi:hypothetical protein
MAMNVILSDIQCEKQEDGTNICKIIPHNNISKEELIEMISSIYDEELKEENQEIVLLNLKHLSSELKAEVFKYAFTREDIKDPLTTLNILNLIKIYNTLDETFFEDENVWFNSLEDLLDLKLLIHSELKTFVRQFSIYFLSLIKSYNKMTYTLLDNNIELPQLYKTLFLSMDFMTAAGIFSVSNPINTTELLCINDPMKYLTEMMVKNCLGISLFNDFLSQQES